MLDTLLSSVFGYMGQQETNNTNIEIANNNSAFNAAEADKARQFNAAQGDISRSFNYDQALLQKAFNSEEATKQRNWTEEMSGSQYQRAIADMAKAGLNPMLAYQHGGSAASGGSTASASPAGSSNVSGPSASAASNAIVGNKNLAGLQSAQLAAQVATTSAQAENVRAQTKNVQADTANKEAENPYIAGKYGHQQADRQRLLEERDRLYLEGTRIVQAANLTQKQKDLVVEEIENAKEERRRIRATTGNLQADSALKRINTKLNELEVPGATNKQESEQTWWGRNVRPYLRDFQSGASSALSTRRIAR